MWGSNILDTVIGVIFVFLLVSLLVTIINELIASALRSRATWLRRGIDRLLGGNWAGRFYQHPLVSGSAQQGENPSYIPSRSFANVIVDLLRDGDPTITTARTAMQDVIAAAAAPDVTVASLQGSLQTAAAQILATGTATGRRMAADITQLDLSLQGPVTIGSAITAIKKFVDEFPSSYVRETIASLPDELPIKKQLLTLYDDAQNDLEQFKQNVETWFNNAMDRVGGWYKRRAQLVTLLIGLGLAVGLNVDTVLIARHLQTDPAMRDALVAEAIAYTRTAPAKLVAPARNVLCPPGETTDSSGRPCVKLQSASAIDHVVEPAPADDDPDKLLAQYQTVRTELGKLGLPIGWKTPVTADTFWGILAAHWLGWLITALAATLGAPFWFDTLNRLMSIRSAGKAPEEAPKPPKEVPEPLEPGRIPVR